MSPITSTLANGSAYGYRTLAAAAAGSYESIATVTSSGGVATLSFTSIPSTYVALQIRGSNLQSENGTTGTYGFGLSFNSDSGANYTYHSLVGDGATASSAGSVAGTPYQPIARYTRNSETAKGAVIFDIHNYASTTQNKTVRGFGGCDMNGAGYLYGGSSLLWLSTSAITSITFGGNGNWKTGSTFSLYGIKGA
jgi:hypothetical protein